MQTYLEPPFRLVRWDGYCLKLADLASVGSQLPYLRGRAGLWHRPQSCDNVDSCPRTAEWVIRDALDTPVHPDIAAAACPLQNRHQGICSEREKLQQQASARGLPIPYTGGRRYKRYGLFYRRRYGDTFMQAHRAYVGFKADLRGDPDFYEAGFWWKPERKPRNGPIPFDDRPPPVPEHGWKRHRKHQWKPVRCPQK